MKKHLLFIYCYLLITVTAFSQEPQWQWAHRGGGNQNSGFNDSWSGGLEQIFDVKIDQFNNYYFAGTVTKNNPVFMGQAIPKYATNNIDTDIYIVSTDCEGNYRWHTTLGGEPSELYASIALDDLGGLYISFAAINSSRSNNTNVPTHFAPGVALGYGTNGANPNPNNRCIALVKYDTNGNYLWHHMPQDENVISSNVIPGYFNARALAYALIAEPDGTVHWHCRFAPGNHLNGQLVVPTDVTEYHAILKYDKDGNYLGHIPLPFTGGAGQIQTKLHRDPLNGRYYFYLTTGNSSGLQPATWKGETLTSAGALYALDAQGNELWRKIPSSPSHISATVWGVTTDENSNVYLTGNAGNQTINGLFASFAGYAFTQHSSSPYVIKLNSDGDLLWGTNLNPATGASATQQNACLGCHSRSIVVNGDEVATVGSLLNSSWGNLTMPRVYGNGPAPVLVRFNRTTGAPIAMHLVHDVLGNNASEEIMTVAKDHNGNYVVGGYARNTIFVNHPTIAPLTSNGGYSDFFIAKLGSTACDALAVENPNIKNIQLYPNPTQGVVHVKGGNRAIYTVYNMLGQEVASGNILDDEILNLSALSKGTYLVRLTLLDGKVVTEKVVVE
jgi:hypothetical protein